MKEKRYNIFSKSHKGLHRLVFEAGSRIQKTDFNNLFEVNNCVAVLLQAIRYFIYHIKKEDVIIYKAIQPFAPYIVSMMEKTNETSIALALSIEEKVGEYNGGDVGHSIIEFGIELQASLFSFTSVVLQNIKKEDTVLNELLWENYDDSQLLDIEVCIVNQFLPEENKWFTGQVVKWLNDLEIAGWMNEILSCGNSVEADKLIKSARAVLPESRWQLISDNFELQRA